MKLLHLDKDPFWTLPYRNAGRDGLPCRAFLPLYRGRVDKLPDGLAALVAASDLQGREDDEDDRLLGLLLAEELEELAQAGLVPPLGEIGLLLAGDLYGVPGSLKRGGSGNVGEVWRAFAERFRWVAGVLGNHDLLQWNLPMIARLLDNSVAHLDGLRIAGLSGIVGDPKRPNRRSAAEFAGRIVALAAGRPDLLILHQGPDRLPHPDPTVADALTGARNLFLLCGHSPWPDPLLAWGESCQALNVDGRVVVLTAG
jgi:hypothetical protein